MDRVWNTLDGDQVVVSKAKTWESPAARAHGGRISPTASGPGTSWARGHEGSYGSHPPVALPVPTSRAVTPRVPRGKGDGLKPIIVRRRRRSATPPKNVVRFGKASTFLTTAAPSSVGKADRGEPKYSAGRRNAAVGLGAYHSAIAAKPGQKLRATGRTMGEAAGGGITGGTLGHLAGRALTRGKPMGALAGQLTGQLGGGYAGTYHAFRANNRKGRYKPEQ